MKQRIRKPDIILTNGKPAAVILSIAEYEELLERAEDAADLRTLRAMRRKPLRFRKLHDVLREQRRV
jgi:PHD/YefM family antitoxin component YafN of YafNO toxin-antitoxin module